MSDTARCADLLTQSETRWSCPPSSRMTTSVLLKVLANALLSGEQETDAATARLGQVLGRNWRWIRPLTRRYLEAFAGHTRPRRREVHPHFREHLLGRLGFIESVHPEKGRCLRAIFDKITWE